MKPPAKTASAGSFAGVFALAIAIAAPPLTASAHADRPQSAETGILAVRGESSSGYGFLCEMDGRTYFVTGKDVIAGQRQVSACFPDGRRLKLGKMEIDDAAGIVRFSVRDDPAALKPSDEEPRRLQKVWLYRKSGSEEAMSAVRGILLEVGSEYLQTSARFSRRESGSALLDENGRVLGVAAFPRIKPDPNDWVRRPETEKTKPVARRLAGLSWKTEDFSVFSRRTRAQREKELADAGVFPQADAVFKRPSLRVNVQKKNGGAAYFINGNIVLGLSRSKEIKNPVVRVAVLLEAGGRIVMDAVAEEPGGKYAHASIPILSYGMAKTTRTFRSVNGVSAFFLEGLSFYQPVMSLDSYPGGGKNMEYFDRSLLLSGGIEIPRKALKGGITPKITAFRLECWQNGCLSGFYDSVRPDTLVSKDIPEDWFVTGRYPEKFVYAGSR